MSKFKVGDIITGNHMSDDEYGITTSKMTKGEVLEVRTLSYSNRDVIEVKVLEHEVDKGSIGYSHVVEEKYFDLVERVKEAVDLEEVVKPYTGEKSLYSLEYDNEKECGFIIFDEKITVSIPVSRERFDAIGISSKHDDDEYVEEVGKALACFRTTRA